MGRVSILSSHNLGLLNDMLLVYHASAITSKDTNSQDSRTLRGHQ